MHLFRKPLEVCSCILAGGQPNLQLYKDTVVFLGTGNIPQQHQAYRCMGCGASEEAVMVTMRMNDIEWFTDGHWDGNEGRIRKEVAAKRGLVRV